MRTEEYTFHPQSVARLASTLLTLVREWALDLPGDEELLDELRNVRVRESSPGVLRLDHDPDRHDDRAIALALAALHVVETMRGLGDGVARAGAETESTWREENRLERRRARALSRRDRGDGWPLPHGSAL